MIEADEKFFRTSFKGSRGWKRKNPPQIRRSRRRGNAEVRGLGNQQVPTLTAVDHSGAIHQARLSDMKHDTIVSTMSPWVESDSIICSDGNDAYAKIGRATGCEHIKAKVKNRNTARATPLGSQSDASTRERLRRNSWRARQAARAKATFTGSKRSPRQRPTRTLSTSKIRIPAGRPWTSWRTASHRARRSAAGNVSNQSASASPSKASRQPRAWGVISKDVHAKLPEHEEGPNASACAAFPGRSPLPFQPKGFW